MSGYRAVLFDFFGTLTLGVRRGPAHAHIARWLGCEPVAFTAALDQSFATRARGGYGSPVKALRRVTASAGAQPSEARLTAAVAARLAAVRADTRLRAEAVPVLAELRAHGVDTAVISDCCHELPQFLPTLPIAAHLSVTVFSIEVGVCKPDPEIYLTACRALGVAPADCLYIGDGGSQELTGARAVGMSAVRLAAPDLASHLVYDADQSWSGPCAGTLREAVAPALGGLAGGGESYELAVGGPGEGVASGGVTSGAVSASAARSAASRRSGPRLSRSIFSWSRRMPCSSASGRGGQPGT